MNCVEFWNNPNRCEAARHLERCASCAAAWNGQQIIVGSLRELAAAQSGTEAPAHIEARLRAAFRGHVSLGSGRQEAGWVPLLTWGSAAAALVAVAFLLVQARVPADLAWQSPAAVQFAGRETPLSPGEFVDSEAAQAAGFISLPNSAEFDPSEEVNLVRLELPRSAIVALGLELNEDRASEAVAADVMLGHDGLARAVRFLEE